MKKNEKVLNNQLRNIQSSVTSESDDELEEKKSIENLKILWEKFAKDSPQF